MPAGPSMPPAPGLFSITIGWPRCFDASSASLRRWVSVEPPAGQGTMRVIARVGKSWAAAGPATSPAASRAAAARALTVVMTLMTPPCVRVSGVGLDAGALYDALPLGDLAVEEARGLGGARSDRFHAERREAIAQFRRGEHTPHLAGEAVDHVRGRSRRREEHDPGRTLDRRPARFGKRRDLGRAGHAGGRKHPEGADLAGAHMRHHRAGHVREDLDVARD